MAVSILLAQAGKPVGDAGFARDDFATGVDVTATLIGGPYQDVLWTLPDKPVDLSVPAQSNAFIADPKAQPTATIQNCDRKGTYLLYVVVDQGYGLGARPEDIAEIAFYAGPVLSSTWNRLPRRIMAFLERKHFNVKTDPIFGSLGNKRGWAQEWARWFGVLEYVYSLATMIKGWGAVTLTGGGASLSVQHNVNVTRFAQGIVDVTFITQFGSANYVVLGSASAAGTSGSTNVYNKTAAGFRIERYNSVGGLADANFDFAVLGL